MGELAAIDEVAEREWRLAQKVEEQVAAWEAAMAGELAAKDAGAEERLAEMEGRLTQREEEHADALGARKAAAADERTAESQEANVLERHIPHDCVMIR